MGFEALQYLIMGFLFINVFILVYMVLNKVKTSNTNLPEALEDKEIIHIKMNKKRFNIENKVESLILKSNIRKYVLWINSRIVMALSVVLGITAFIVSYKFLGNSITSLVFLIAFGFIPSYILNVMVGYNSSKVERSFLYFLSVLSNFAQLRDDVFYAFEKSVDYVDEPLNGYSRTVVEEVKRGLPIEDALENFKEKIDSKKFKMFLRNAQLCVKFGGSFLKLSTNNLELVKQLQIEKARRKNETSLGRVLIVVMMGINIGLAVYMFNMYPNTLEMIKTDFYGQMVILVNTIDLFIAFYMSLKLQKLDY